jgi:hypothetical protein
LLPTEQSSFRSRINAEDTDLMTSHQSAASESTQAPPGTEQWFPRRWVGGTALILAPLLLLAGVLLKLQFPFFFPHQLSAYAQHSTLLTAAYSSFLAGNILMWPAVLTLTHLIMTRCPGLAIWGGSLTLLGLFARTFHAGIDHLAFQLVRLHGAPLATTTVASSYGAFHVVSSLNAAISIVATTGLCIALVPLGGKVLWESPRPPLRHFAAWVAFLAVFSGVLFYTGQLG